MFAEMNVFLHNLSYSCPGASSRRNGKSGLRRERFIELPSVQHRSDIEPLSGVLPQLGVPLNVLLDLFFYIKMHFFQKIFAHIKKKQYLCTRFQKKRFCSMV